MGHLHRAQRGFRTVEISCALEPPHAMTEQERRAQFEEKRRRKELRKQHAKHQQ
jgi:hypothetical protein